MVAELTCGFCGVAFKEDQAQPTCAGCPLKQGCQLARCPHCGYENPIVPVWLTRLRNWFRASDERSDNDAHAWEDICP